MRFAVRFYKEDEWWMSEASSFGQVTQGHSQTEARLMAADLLLNCVAWEWQNGRSIVADVVLPPDHEWVEIPAKALVSAKIQAQRKQASLTMKEAADRLGVSSKLVAQGADCTRDPQESRSLPVPKWGRSERSSKASL